MEKDRKKSHLRLSVKSPGSTLQISIKTRAGNAKWLLSLGAAVGVLALLAATVLGIPSEYLGDIVRKLLE